MNKYANKEVSANQEEFGRYHLQVCSLKRTTGSIFPSKEGALIQRDVPPPESSSCLVCHHSFFGQSYDILANDCTSLTGDILQGIVLTTTRRLLGNIPLKGQNRALDLTKHVFRPEFPRNRFS